MVETNKRKEEEIAGGVPIRRVQKSFRNPEIVPRCIAIALCFKTQILRLSIDLFLPSAPELLSSTHFPLSLAAIVVRATRA